MLQVGYWQADRCAFSVYPWTADGNLAAQELLFAPTWVVLKNVPPQLYSLDGISVVASGIRDPLHTEKSRLDPYLFGDTKVKVKIDLSKTPPEVVEVRDTQGNSVRVNVEYPSLPPKCRNCGKFDHLVNRCNKDKRQRVQPQKKRRVISVVKSGSEVSLSAEYRAEDKEESAEKVEAGQELKSKAKSRPRKRSRSRARALNSPPEDTVGLEVTKARSDLSVKAQDYASLFRVKESTVVNSEPVVEPVEDSYQLEEGEIKGEEVEELGQGVMVSQNEVHDQEEEESLWLTKHSKNFRRALRQHKLWESS